jgi:hypothetical protein
MAMKKGEAFDAIVNHLFVACNGYALTAQGNQVHLHLDGFLEAPIEEQVSFLNQMTVKGLLRASAERVSSAKSEQEAQAKLELEMVMGYQMGARGAVARITTVDQAAVAVWVRNFTKGFKDGKSAFVKLAGELGVTLVEKVSDGGKKMTVLSGHTDNATFNEYVSVRTAKPDYQKLGEKELARLQAERDAKTSKKSDALL